MASEFTRTQRRNVRNCLIQLEPLLPNPWDAIKFTARVSRQLGRHIMCVPVDLEGTELSGLWIADAGRDMIFYRSDATPHRRDVAICHEIAHIVLEHDQRGAHLHELARGLAPSVSEEARRRVLARDAVFDHPDEMEAESLATELLARIERLTPPEDNEIHVSERLR